MATQDLSAQLDIGPTTCSVFSVFNSCSNSIDKAWQFAENDKGYVDQLAQLLDDYKVYIQPKLHSQLVPFYVARWIHFTNKIEFSGFADEGETRELVMKGRKQSGSVTEREVLQTLDILRTTYKPEYSSLERVTSQFPKLKKWHTIFFTDILENPGHFRQCGAYAEPLEDSSAHLYPHHSILDKAVEKWIQLCYMFAKEISNYQVPSAKIRFLFAFAAFAQFHIVDIHPFADGNGRICRFVSKYILDEILPLPIPMFEDRQKYLASLIQGRSLSAENAPQFLYQLLLETAVATYRDILTKYKTYTIVLEFFACSNEKELDKELQSKKGIEEHVKAEIKHKFQSLKIGQSETVYKKDVGVYKFMKMAEVHDVFDVSVEDL